MNLSSFVQPSPPSSFRTLVTPKSSPKQAPLCPISAGWPLRTCPGSGITGCVSGHWPPSLGMPLGFMHAPCISISLLFTVTSIPSSGCAAHTRVSAPRAHTGLFLRAAVRMLLGTPVDKSLRRLTFHVRGCSCWVRGKSVFSRLRNCCTPVPSTCSAGEFRLHPPACPFSYRHSSRCAVVSRCSSLDFSLVL